MTPEERTATLRDLLPGLQDFHYEALAAEHASSTQGGPGGKQQLPIVDVMMRLRFNDAKVLRIKHYCGAAGAELLDACYCRFRDRLAGEEARDFTVAPEVAAHADDSDAAADAIPASQQQEEPEFDWDPFSKRAVMARRAAAIIRQKYGIEWGDVGRMAQHDNETQRIWDQLMDGTYQAPSTVQIPPAEYEAMQAVQDPRNWR